MKFLNSAEVGVWWGKQPELLAGHGRSPGTRLASCAVDANFEKRQQSAYAIARAIAAWLIVCEDPVLAHVFEHGIWRSSENLHLYYVWRRSHGERSLLDDARGHLFLKHEREELATLIHLCFLFGWGVSCAEAAGQRAFHVDHDGHGVAIAPSQAEIAEIARFLT